MKNQAASYENVDLYLISATLPYQVNDPDPMETVIETVCRHFRICPALVYSKSREKEISECRIVCMYFLRQRGSTLKAIGLYLGGRDHSGVYADLLALNGYLETSQQLREKFEILSLAV